MFSQQDFVSLFNPKFSKILYKNLPRFSDGRKCALLAKSWPKIFKWQLSAVTKILMRPDLACHYLTNRFQMEAPVAPSRSLRVAFKRAPRSLRGACLREGFAEPPRRHHEPFAEVYEPFAEVAHTKGSTKTPWRVHEASSKGPWMNCMFLLDHDCNRVWSILYCF